MRRHESTTMNHLTADSSHGTEDKRGISFLQYRGYLGRGMIDRPSFALPLADLFNGKSRRPVHLDLPIIVSDVTLGGRTAALRSPVLVHA